MLRPERRPVLILDSPALRRLDVSEGEYDARVVQGWDALHEAMAGAHPSTIALVDPYVDRRGGGPSPRLREALWKHPSVPVVAALVLRNERAEDVATLLEWGVSEVLDLDLEPTPRALAARIRAAHARPLKRRVEAVLSPYVSLPAGDIVRAAADVAVDGGAAPDLAKRFGVEPRTLSAWCARESLPPPRRLQAWLRVLLAATLLEEPARTVANAARSAGYANDHALRRAMRELVGGDPATLPREKTFEAAARAFNDELLAVREKVRERRRARAAGSAARE